MPEVFYDRWKKAKTAFENKTGKKKPDSASALGKLVNKINSSGLEGSLKAFDAAKDPKGALKAAKSFEKAANNYLPILDKAQKAAKKEGNEIYSEACLELSAYLLKISGKVMAAVDRFKGFPEDVEAAFRSPYWKRKLQKTCKKEDSSDNFEFLDMYYSGKIKFNEECINDIYDTYIRKGSKKELNLNAAILKKCREAVESKNWKKFPVEDIVDVCLVNVMDPWGRFVESFVLGTD